MSISKLKHQKQLTKVSICEQTIGGGVDTQNSSNKTPNGVKLAEWSTPTPEDPGSNPFIGISFTVDC